MRKTIAALAGLLALAGAAGARAQTAAQYRNGDGSYSGAVYANGLPVTNPTGSSSITTGGAPQALFNGVTPVHGWKVENLGASNCYVSDETTSPNSSTPGSYTVFAGGGQYATELGQLPAGPVYLECPTTGQAFSAQKW